MQTAVENVEAKTIKHVSTQREQVATKSIKEEVSSLRTKEKELGLNGSQKYFKCLY